MCQPNADLSSSRGDAESARERLGLAQEPSGGKPGSGWLEGWLLKMANSQARAYFQ
jgi:hypothetical protein